MCEASSSKPEPAGISPAAKFLGACILFAGAQGGGDLEKAVETAEKLAALFTPTQSDRAALLQWAREHVQTNKSWADGIRYITRELRTDRAERKLLKVLNDPRASQFRKLKCAVYNPELKRGIFTTRGLADWKKRGFINHELKTLTQLVEFISLQGANAKNQAPRAKKTGSLAKRRHRPTRKSSK